MIRQVRCECGDLIRGRSEDEVIPIVMSHIASKHPGIAETATADEIRNWIELVPD